MMATEPMEIAIIGAGLGGCLIAISLATRLPCNITIYESRHPEAPEVMSGIMITPNGLHILDKLGVYDRIKDICWKTGYRTFKNEKDETTKRVLVASEELYGYENHRLYRRVFLHILFDMISDLPNVSVKHESRFGQITHEDSTGVTFTINNSPLKADLLLGTDGIFSTVRKYLDPSITPEYTGTVGVLAHIHWSSVSWPSPEFEKQCTIQGMPGAFFLQPETKTGSEVMVGLQVKHAAQTREEWDTMAADKDAMCALFRRDYARWHPTAQKVIDAVTSGSGKESLYLWPFLRMPRLQRWFSPHGKVILLGDAAHAIPPSSGQGVNQVLEDLWGLTLLLTQTQKGRVEALGFWQEMRQDRVDVIYDWAVNARGVQRMGREERDRLIKEGKVPDPDREGAVFFDDMAWLYRYRGEEEIREWLDT